MAAALYGAPADGPIRREYKPGRIRAARGSVRWRYVKPGKWAAVRTGGAARGAAAG